MAVPIWLIVAAAAVIFMLIVFRTMNQVYILSLIKKHFFWYFAIGIIIFVAISLARIHTTNDISLSTSEGWSAAGKIYLSWLQNVGRNIGKVTGYAVKQDWINASG